MTSFVWRRCRPAVLQIFSRKRSHQRPGRESNESGGLPRDTSRFLGSKKRSSQEGSRWSFCGLSGVNLLQDEPRPTPKTIRSFSGLVKYHTDRHLVKSIILLYQTWQATLASKVLISKHFFGKTGQDFGENI